MVKGIPNNMKVDGDFSHRYAGGVNQYGTKGAESPDEFQGYMNDGMTAQTAGGKSPTPMNLMSSPTNPNFGPPATNQPGTLQGAAPENFGPPGVGATGTDNQAKFGPPGFEGNSTEAPDLRAASKDTMGTKPLPMRGKPSPTLGTHTPPSENGSGKNLQAGNSGDGGADGAKESSEEHKKSYHDVEKMMTEQMIQGAITRMKIKHSDVWKE